MSNPNFGKESPKTWKPGQSGNPKGRPKKGTSLTELMNEYLDTCPEGQEITYREIFIRKTYQKAIQEGNDAAMKLIWNYHEGMPRQPLEHSGPDGAPIEHNVHAYTDEELAEILRKAQS